MKILINNLEIKKSLEIAKKYVDLSLFYEQYNIEFTKVENKGYKIVKNNNNISITYNKKNQIFAALLYVEANKNESYEYECTPAFNDLGIMIDCARNGVLNIETIKKTIVQLALIGYNSFQLYLEDCFEVENEEMFGYMRGAYSEKDLKELDSFSNVFGIELIPCIQTLAHLNQIFRWSEYQPIKDIDDILLIENERTYLLVENMIKTVRRCFSSNRIHINMDEAHNLGRGRYLDRNGYKEAYKLFVDHKNKVVELCKKYDFKPMMWSDMFFRNVNNHKYYVNDEKLDFKGLEVNDAGLIYWDYYHLKQSEYEKMIKVHNDIGNDVVFAGGIWLWRGLVPYIKYTEATMLPALRACKKYKIDNVFFTMWGDDGSECLKSNALGSYIFLSECSNSDKLDKNIIDEKCRALTGYSYKQWLVLDKPNFIDTKDSAKYNVNPSKYLLYMDPLLSVYDNLVNPNYDEFYREVANKLHNLAKKNKEYSYLFELESKLCKVLSYKATLSVKIKEAYDNKNIEDMKKCLDNVKSSIKHLHEFYSYYRNCWMKEYKMIGFEIQDVRLGGLIGRLNYIKDLLEEYIDKGSIVIEELEIERKKFDSVYMTKNNESLITNYANIVSTNRLSW